MDYNAQYQAYLGAAEAALAQQAGRCLNARSRVCEAARYSLFGGGKRVRAVLCLAVCDMLGGNGDAAACYAAGVEMLHCYSLIHDDLPCMDNDDLRRGRPSCHKAFGEATALLAGDTLLTAAFEALSGSPGAAGQNNAAVCALSRAAGANGMVWGQELDLAFEKKPATAEELREVHRNKTGMLINAAAQMGAIAANADEAQRQAIERYAFSVGLVFQIADDILDVTATAQQLGKPIGSDAANGKTTFVTLYGVERSRGIAQELTDEACDVLRATFGGRARFLEAFAASLLERNQ